MNQCVVVININKIKEKLFNKGEDGKIYFYN